MKLGTMELVEENLSDLGLGSSIFNKAQRAQATQEKVADCSSPKINNCSLSNPVRNMKSLATDQKKIKKHISDKKSCIQYI